MSRENEQTKKKQLNIEAIRKLGNKSLIRYMKSVQRGFRYKMYLEKANQEYSKIIKIFSERKNTELEIDIKDHMLLEYEISHTEYLLGNFNSAITHSQKSTDYAHKIGNELGYAISYFHTALMRFFGNTISNEETYKDFESSLTKIIECRQQGVDIDRCNNWIFNIQNRLIQLLVEMKNTEEAELRFEQCCQSGAFHQLFIKPDAEDFTLIKYYSNEAKIYHAQGLWEKSLSIYAKFLDIDLSEWGDKDKRMSGSAKNEGEAAAHYYYIGKNLLELNLKERALEIYKTGLALKPEQGNHYFQSKIRSEFSQLIQNK